MKITFGKYKGKEVEDVIKINPSYLLWADKNVSYFQLPFNLKEQCIKEYHHQRFINGVDYYREPDEFEDFYMNETSWDNCNFD